MLGLSFAFAVGPPANATQANALAFVGQPWSYLRLKAYSFFGLCEGAYGAFGGSCRTTAHRA